MTNYYKLCILFASNLIISNTLANSDFICDNNYTPILDFSATRYKARSIVEADLMLPVWQQHNALTVVDLKYKNDRKSYEYNLGLVYRYNNNDQYIFGIYNYFDHRKTENNLYVNQWTVGSEILSRYFDARLNFYIPQNKKKIVSTQPKELKRSGTAIYAIDGGKFQEHTLLGYDIELGTPLFALSPKLDEKLGTKIFLAKYDFTRKKVVKNSGVRLRLEQQILENNQFILTLHLGTHYTNQKKWDNFIGFNIRVPLSDTYRRKTKMQKRMMDIVVRDVDIKAAQGFDENSGKSRESLYFQNKKINDIYFVSENKIGNGDGTYENPLSIKQRNKLRREGKTDFLIVSIGTFSRNGYDRLLRQGSVIEIIENEPILLKTNNGNASFDLSMHIPELQKRDLLSIIDNRSTSVPVSVVTRSLDLMSPLRIIRSIARSPEGGSNTRSSEGINNSPPNGLNILENRSMAHSISILTLSDMPLTPSVTSDQGILQGGQELIIPSAAEANNEVSVAPTNTIILQAIPSISDITEMNEEMQIQDVNPLLNQLTGQNLINRPRNQIIDRLRNFVPSSESQSALVQSLQNPRMYRDFSNLPRVRTRSLESFEPSSESQRALVASLLNPRMYRDFSNLPRVQTRSLESFEPSSESQRALVQSLLNPRLIPSAAANSAVNE